MKTKTTMVILIVTAIMLVGVTVIHKTTNLLTCTGIPYNYSMFLLSEDGGYIVTKNIVYKEKEGGDTLIMAVFFYPLDGNTIFPQANKDWASIICMDRYGDGTFDHMYFTLEEGTSSLMFVGDNQDDPESWVCKFPNRIPKKMILPPEKEHFIQMLSGIKNAKKGNFLCY